MEEGRIEIFTFEMLLHDKKVLSVLENVVHSDDVRLACIHQYFELIDEKIIDSGFLTQQIFL